MNRHPSETVSAKVVSRGRTRDLEERNHSIITSRSFVEEVHTFTRYPAVHERLDANGQGWYCATAQQLQIPQRTFIESLVQIRRAGGFVRFVSSINTTRSTEQNCDKYDIQRNDDALQVGGYRVVVCIIPRSLRICRDTRLRRRITSKTKPEPTTLPTNFHRRVDRLSSQPTRHIHATGNRSISTQEVQYISFH